MVTTVSVEGDPRVLGNVYTENLWYIIPLNEEKRGKRMRDHLLG